MMISFGYAAIISAWDWKMEWNELLKFCPHGHECHVLIAKAPLGLTA